MIVGNTVLYGAIEGECYFRGVAGERFAVRNSGATAVVEGAGDHCCEYMTGGIVVVLGKVGRNFGAGMSGGIAYVLDEDESLNDLYNSQMVELETIIESKDDIKDEFLDNHLFNDSERLKKLITNHMHYTNSETAEKIVNDFSIYLKKFKKVMNYNFILMNGYGIFVWSSFIITFLVCGIFYYKTRKSLKKYEKEFAKEIEALSTEQKKTVLENSKVASKVLSSFNKSI